MLNCEKKIQFKIQEWLIEPKGFQKELGQGPDFPNLPVWLFLLPPSLCTCLPTSPGATGDAPALLLLMSES